jgi:hypothetical protein
MKKWYLGIILLLTILSGFSVKELFKKFSFWQEYAQAQGQIIWEHTGEYYGMRKIVLSADQPFGVLMGVKIFFPISSYDGWDAYGYLESNEDNEIVIETFLGKRAGELMFLPTGVSLDEVIISVGDEVQDKEATKTFKPHWWQYLGI